MAISNFLSDGDMKSLSQWEGISLILLLCCCFSCKGTQYYSVLWDSLEVNINVSFRSLCLPDYWGRKYWSSWSPVSWDCQAGLWGSGLNQFALEIQQRACWDFLIHTRRYCIQPTSGSGWQSCICCRTVNIHISVPNSKLRTSEFFFSSNCRLVTTARAEHQQYNMWWCFEQRNKSSESDYTATLFYKQTKHYKFDSFLLAGKVKKCQSNLAEISRSS